MVSIKAADLAATKIDTYHQAVIAGESLTRTRPSCRSSSYRFAVASLRIKAALELERYGNMEL